MSTVFEGTPSPQEIAELCEQIRAGWSEDEHRLRAAGLELSANGMRTTRGSVAASFWSVPVCRAMNGLAVPR